MGGLRRACESLEKRGSWDLEDNRSGVNCLPIDCGCDAQYIVFSGLQTGLRVFIRAFGKTTSNKKKVFFRNAVEIHASHCPVVNNILFRYEPYVDTVSYGV
ncbi:hypothetical protein PABG_11859 [Paracoccidioides brasiliensis Pb03]|nr:hypothetical protein PABG_11859 [Paracoccidioides brasiliensis Pb03]